MQPAVSIIVPVHNMERYLWKCLESVAAQTMPDIEVIIINDCSTDNSALIAKEFDSGDNRFRLIENRQRQGLYKNRQIGVREAKGRYVQYVDADDWLEPEATERLANAMSEFNVDLVQMRSHRIVSNIKSNYGRSFDADLEGRKIDGEDFRSLASFIGMSSYITPSCWDKMYRRDLLRDIFHLDFKEFWGEDQIVNIQYMRHASSIVFIDYFGYNYRWGGESTRYKFGMLQSFKNIWNLKKIMHLDSEHINDELQHLLRYHIRQLSTELVWTPEAIIHYLRKELQDPIWHEIGINTDAETLVKQEMSSIKRKPLKYLVKRLIR